MTWWFERARCRQLVARGDALPDDWHPSEHKARTVPALLAVAACMECEVRRDCLSYAVRHPGLDGIWGGLTPAQRTRLAARS